MNQRRSAPGPPRPLLPTPRQDRGELTRGILRAANAGTPRVPFLRQVSSLLLDFTGCDLMEVRLRDQALRYRFLASRHPRRSFRFLPISDSGAEGSSGSLPRGLQGLDRVCQLVLEGQTDESEPGFTRNGSFWTDDTHRWAGPRSSARRRGQYLFVLPRDRYRSIAIMRFLVDDDTAGLILLKCTRPGAITKKKVEFWESVAQTFGLAVSDRRAQAALRERVKEQTCLYRIAKLAEDRDRPIDETLAEITRLLPQAWQFPDRLAVEITLDGKKWTTPGFSRSRYRQRANISVSDQLRGSVEVTYPNGMQFSENPFQPEEQSLLEAIVGEIGFIVERKATEEERTNLQEQLRHADRLATLGQLAAGIAHELSEPLGGILGFAQLARKWEGVPGQVDQDLEKIVAATLHAREIVRKLLLFARRLPTQKTRLRLEDIVREAFEFLEPRCARAGIQMVRDLADDVPLINADAGQMQQMIVNLAVNSVQAMPRGGCLTVRARRKGDWALFIVEDTGMGMSQEVQKQVFVPFFTTKGIGEGTGLGLSVVHGIITSHGGTISFHSEVGKGTRFDIRLPAADRVDTELGGSHASNRR